MKKVFLTYYSWSSSVKAALTSMFALVAFVVGAILEDGVQRIAGDQPSDLPWGIVWLLVGLICAGAWGFLNWRYRMFLESHGRSVQIRQRSIEDARERITTLNIEHLAQCDAFMENETISPDEFRSVLICEKKRLEKLITAAWGVVNAYHNVSDSPLVRINFELTLITPSFLDPELTIAAWCNRDNHRPVSLLSRLKDEPSIYKRTEAAKMISHRITDTLIIENTSAPTVNYEALYEGQKARIRSSVLHPILSPKSEHLGIVVLHCDQTGFFRNEDHRYWRELFKVFAPSIALEIERIKAFNKATTDWPKPPIEQYCPY